MPFSSPLFPVPAPLKIGTAKAVASTLNLTTTYRTLRLATPSGALFDRCSITFNIPLPAPEVPALYGPVYTFRITPPGVSGSSGGLYLASSDEVHLPLPPAISPSGTTLGYTVGFELDAGMGDFDVIVDPQAYPLHCPPEQYEGIEVPTVANYVIDANLPASGVEIVAAAPFGAWYLLSASYNNESSGVSLIYATDSGGVFTRQEIAPGSSSSEVFARRRTTGPVTAYSSNGPGSFMTLRYALGP